VDEQIASLRRGLKVEVESALAGEVPQSAVLLLRDDRLPRALATDSKGVVHPRVISYVDLLATLENSVTITELRKEPERVLPLPPLPPGTLLVDLVERASSNLYVVTGLLPPDEHLFAVRQGGEASTYLIPLPSVCYRVVWNEATRRASALSLALCPLTKDVSGSGRAPDPDTPLFRWPFSNVYPTFGGIREGVCWYEYKSVELDVSETPEKLVRAFIAIENDADRYAGDLTHSAPYGGYRTFLEAIERGGGLDEEWLKPCGLTIRELHDQHKRKGSESA
jgi:hypothetical protein